MQVMSLRRWLCRRLISLTSILLLAPFCTLGAQYFNAHTGHPGRIEDAAPAARRSVDFDLFGIRVEQLSGDIRRVRTEPGFAWGVLPNTEIGLRLPIVWHDRPSAAGRVRQSGVAGVGLSAMRALTVETPHTPALAIGAEWLVSAGGFRAPRSVYLLKAMATRRVAGMRVHANAGAGTWSVRAPQATCDSTASTCSGPPVIVDLPCNVNVRTPLLITDAPTRRLAMLCGPGASLPTVADSIRPREHGARWMAGVGVDKALPLSSVLLSTDVVVERFSGLYAQTDVTAEAGVRWQVATRTVLDAGVSWRIAGALRAVSLTIGSSIEVAMPLLVPRP